MNPLFAICLFGFCLQSPLKHVHAPRPAAAIIRCIAVGKQDNCAVTPRDKKQHSLVAPPALLNPIPFSGGGTFWFSSTTPLASVLIDGITVPVSR